jgi:hypothetical protein
MVREPQRDFITATELPANSPEGEAASEEPPIRLISIE